MKTSLGLMILFTALALAGCKKEEPAGEGPAQPSEPPAAPTAEALEPEPPTTEWATGTIENTLAAYEAIRAHLAADRVAEAIEAAARLEQAARTTATEASKERKEHLDAIAAAAAKLKAAEASEPAEVRRLFGEVSRPTIALLSADPSLAKGHHVFRCPMAQGYKKWVQTSDTISNPYMGTRMLKCGSESTWEP